MDIEISIAEILNFETRQKAVIIMLLKSHA